MTKKEVLDEIIYNLKMNDSADFEVNERESYTIDHLTSGAWRIQSSDRYMECRNLTEVRKTISKLGKNLLCL